MPTIKNLYLLLSNVDISFGADQVDQWIVWPEPGFELRNIYKQGDVYVLALTINTVKGEEDLKEKHPDDCVVARDTDDAATTSKNITVSDAIQISRDILQRIKDETGSPGVAVAVSVDGRTVWSEGWGYSDVENRVPCCAESVFRIGSISKSITMATVAKLVETGDLDLDKPIQRYVPNFPEKTFNGEKVDITTRQLVSHLSGIRHYKKRDVNQNDKNNNSAKTIEKQPIDSTPKTDIKDKQSEKFPPSSTYDDQSEKLPSGSTHDDQSEKLPSGSKSKIGKNVKLSEKLSSISTYGDQSEKLPSGSTHDNKSEKLPSGSTSKIGKNVKQSEKLTSIPTYDDQSEKLPSGSTHDDQSEELPSGSTSKIGKNDKQSEKLPSISTYGDQSEKLPSCSIPIMDTNDNSTVDKMEIEECLITKHYNSVEESLCLFKDDPLVHKPGTTFLYTTHGWTLISAVVEGVTQTPFDKHLKTTLNDLGMTHTYLDEHEPIIYRRGRHYMKNKKGRLINTPYLDLSYKLAGGGLISNVLDVTKFGNAMLYSYQATSNYGCRSEKDHKSVKTSKGPKIGDLDIPGYLKPETMKMIFMPVDKTHTKTIVDQYGMGWFVSKKKQNFGCCHQQRVVMSHRGGAIGASSVLLILPRETEELEAKGNTFDKLKRNTLPRGVVVAIILNMSSMQLTPPALNIAETFERATQR